MWDYEWIMTFQVLLMLDYQGVLVFKGFVSMDTQIWQGIPFLKYKGSLYILKPFLYKM